jgi:hypothetical protein
MLWSGEGFHWKNRMESEKFCVKAVGYLFIYFYLSKKIIGAHTIELEAQTVVPPF